MRKRARTDLCGGRSVMVVPTATVITRMARHSTDHRGFRSRRKHRSTEAIRDAVTGRSSVWKGGAGYVGANSYVSAGGF